MNLEHPKLYNLYYGIRTRCYNASNHNFPYYQGKGISLCDEWEKSKQTFFDWALSNGWEEGLSIDRLDSSRDYSPENCRFITLSANSKKARKDTPYKIREKNKINSPLSLSDVIKIKNYLIDGIKGTEIARLFNIHKTTVYKIKHNKRWKHAMLPV